MGYARALGPSFALGILALSGCLEDRGTYLSGPFVVEVPAWEAGYSWTYQETSKIAVAATRDDSDYRVSPPEESYRESFTVFNTSRPVNNEDLYYVWRTQESLHGDPEIAYADQSRNFVIFRKSDLREVGQGWVYGDGSWPAAQAQITFTEDSSEPPQFSFPLENGKTWTVDPPGDDGLAYTARVMGRLPMDVLGSSQMAVHVRLIGSAPAGSERDFLEGGFLEEDATWDDVDLTLRFVGDYYWGEEAGNLIRATVHGEFKYTATGTDDEGNPTSASGSFEGDQRRELVEYSLEARPDTPVPSGSIQLGDDEDFRVASQLFPDHDGSGYAMDVGERPVPVGFYVAGYATDEYYYDYYGHGRSGPPRAEYNRTRFEARWTLLRVNDEAEMATGTGPDFKYTFTEPGYYEARMSVHDNLTGLIVTQGASQASITWTKQVMVKQDAGAADRLLILEIPSPAPGGDLQIGMIVQRAIGLSPVHDSGAFILVKPDGTEEILYVVSSTEPSVQTSHYKMLQDTGVYRLEWEPDSSLTSGDDVGAVASLYYAPYYGSY